MTDITEKLKDPLYHPHDHFGHLEEAVKEIERLRNHLHNIRLGSQNSMTTKEDLGKEAGTALLHLVLLSDAIEKIQDITKEK